MTDSLMPRMLLCLLTATLLALAEGRVQAQQGTSVPDTAGLAAPPGYYFPGYVSVTMADGSTRPISAVRHGDEVRCYQNGRFGTSRVQQVEVQEGTCTPVTELYLRPVDERAAGQSTWPLVPALLLEAAPTRAVQTDAGPKAVQELVKGDVLYHFEAATGVASAWKVRIIQASVRSLDKGYSLITDAGSFLVENLVVLNR
jgi:hypothetical protein